MPRTKSVRAIIAEVVMYVGMFAVVGHMSQNLYERFLMQSTLSVMKSDLNTLELIVHNIGLAYDTLREDIHELFRNRESGKHLHPELNAPNIRPTYDSYLLHKQRYIESLPEKQDAETAIEKCTKDFMQNFKRSTKNFRQYWSTPAKDETTFTERLIECMNVGVDTDKNNEVKDFCKCIVKCISHKDDNYKLVNLHKDGNYKVANLQKDGNYKRENLQKDGNYKQVKFPNHAKSKHNVQRVTINETNSTNPENCPAFDSFKTL